MADQRLDRWYPSGDLRGDALHRALRVAFDHIYELRDRERGTETPPSTAAAQAFAFTLINGVPVQPGSPADGQSLKFVSRTRRYEFYTPGTFTQVQADWTQANSAAVDFIKNKPTIPAAQIQSDWTQANNALLDYIKNKPTLGTAASHAATDFAASGAIGSSGLTMATARLLGRTTAGTGAPEEITVGTGLTLSGGTLTSSAGSYTFPYGGDGSDGALVFDGSSVVLGITPAASVYTLARDIFATNITIDAGVSVVGQFRIFATGTLTVNGSLNVNGVVGATGGNATGATAGTAGAAGSAMTAGSIALSGTAGKIGVSGVNGGTTTGSGGTGGAGTNTTNNPGSSSFTAGGNAASGGNGTSGAGGTGGAYGATRTATPNIVQPNAPAIALLGYAATIAATGAVTVTGYASAAAIAGSPGRAGSGGGNGTNAGGGSGGSGGQGQGGGMMIVSAATVTVGAAGSITANGGVGGAGGNGANGTASNCGGGAGGTGGVGGGGGLLIIIHHSLTNSGTISAAPGAGGTGGAKGLSGGGSGTDGGDGVSGVSGPTGWVIQIAV